MAIHDIKDLPRMSIEAAIQILPHKSPTHSHLRTPTDLGTPEYQLPAEAREGESNIPEKSIRSIKARPIMHRV